MYKRILLPILLVCAPCLLSFVKAEQMSGASYCDNDFCSTPDKYCCGRNECCTYVGMWYMWLMFVTGIFVGIFLLWKYYFHVKPTSALAANGILNKILVDSNGKQQLAGRHHGDRFMSSSGQTFAFAYKPLEDDIFIEQQLDDKNVQFNLVRTTSIKNAKNFFYTDNSNNTNNNNSISNQSNNSSSNNLLLMDDNEAYLNTSFSKFNSSNY